MAFEARMTVADCEHRISNSLERHVLRVAALGEESSVLPAGSTSSMAATTGFCFDTLVATNGYDFPPLAKK